MIMIKIIIVIMVQLRLYQRRGALITQCPSALRFRERTGCPRLELSLLLCLWAVELLLRKSQWLSWGGVDTWLGCGAEHSELNFHHIFTPEELSVF